jgi:hypothetical protein
MPRRASSLSLALASLLLAALAAPVRADDPPAEPKPDAPPTEGAAPEKPKEKEKKADHDDTSIYKDWKIAKFRGIKNAKDRAAYWEAKGVAGKDLNWLASLWNRGEEYAKAAEAWEKFLEWKPAADATEKDKNDNDKNRQYARESLISAYLWGAKYPEAVKTAEKFREEFGGASNVGFSWDTQGRALRLAGDTEKALEAFGKAAESKIGKGLFDMIDVYLVDGRVDEARAAIDKYPLEGMAVAATDRMKAFLALVGNDAPSLEKAVNVSASPDLSITWKGKATACYLWHMQLSDGVRRMQNFDAALRDVPNTQTFALATYNKLNPQSQKIEPDMTEEQEVVWYRKLVNDEFPRNIPYAVVVPKEVLEGLGMKGEGQMVVVDAEGKIRWTRTSDQDKYDRMAAKIALEKFAAAPAKKE